MAMTLRKPFVSGLTVGTSRDRPSCQRAVRPRLVHSTRPRCRSWRACNFLHPVPQRRRRLGPRGPQDRLNGFFRR